MKSRSHIAPIVTAAVLAVLFCSSPGLHAQQHQHEHDGSVKLGKVNFPVSCTPSAQKKFNLAAAWLHSFEYDEAEKVFTEITASEPKCGMAYWGVAVSKYHPLWAPPSAAELRGGWQAIEAAKAAGLPTRREQEYVAALESFFKDSDKLDHRTRVLSYIDAMERLYDQNKKDNEAAVLYSLGLIAKGMMAGDKSYVHEKKAAGILNYVLKVEPEHPGVAHYIIHGYDYPALAHLALPAARRYAKIAPASAHAQHMPSHIFTRMGLWQESISSNLDAKASAKAHAVRNKLPGAWDEQLHAMDYLVYAYLQGAQDKKALAVMEELSAIRRVDPPNFKVAYSSTAIPARYALERRQWSEAAKLPLRPAALENLQWERFRWAEAHIHFARAVGASRTGDTAAARQATDALSEIEKSLTEARGDYNWAKQVEIMRLAASAWLAYAEGRSDDATSLMRSAADMDDATEKHPVTPGSLLPAREQMGELLLELKQPDAALDAFEAALKNTPNRFNAVLGAARAAKIAGKPVIARTYYGKLVELSHLADSKRPEIDEANAYLASARKGDSGRK